MRLFQIDKQAIGAKLRELRGNRSQAEIADALGVTSMAISQYERGERIPNDIMKLKIAEYFNVTVTEIFFAQ